jgi:hypothetical protein
MSKQYYAHSSPGRPPEEWQPLENHLKNIAELARKFAEPFGAEEWMWFKFKKEMEVIYYHG